MARSQGSVEVPDVPESEPTVAATVSTDLPAAAAPAPAAPAADLPPSFLERLRRNRVGALAAGLVVAVVVGLLLAVLVPAEPNLYASLVLGALLAAAVGFTVRYLSVCRGLRAQATGFVATVLGVHLMITTGTANAVMGRGQAPLRELLGAQVPGFDDALLAALAIPAVSTGGVVAGLVAMVIVGWGARGHHGAEREL